jgi:multisubunit Na+/H+ antiporter MnhB subunit
MSAETLFSICNTLVLPQWLLLIFAPRWIWTQRLIQSYVIPLLLALAYIFLLATHIHESPDGGFSSLAAVKNLFAADFLLLAGWIHYLAFDLVVGSWIVLDSQKTGLRHWLVVPCLIFTFMLGPFGFLLYQILKRVSAPKTKNSLENV